MQHREHRGQSTEMRENSNGREEDGDKRRYREYRLRQKRKSPEQRRGVVSYVFIVLGP